MSNRLIMAGVLHGSVIRKRKGTLIDRLLVNVLIDEGTITVDDRHFFYAPRYYLTDHGLTNQLDKPLRLLSFKGQPKALSLSVLGHEVEVKASLEEWPNGIGANLVRPQVVAVSNERVTGHTCDSPRACATPESPQ